MSIAASSLGPLEGQPPCDVVASGGTGEAQDLLVLQAVLGVALRPGAAGCPCTCSQVGAEVGRLGLGHNLEAMASQTARDVPRVVHAGA
eukprot:42893-Pyramimonas_sp.AAC.1